MIKESLCIIYRLLQQHIIRYYYYYYSWQVYISSLAINAYLVVILYKEKNVEQKYRIIVLAAHSVICTYYYYSTPCIQCSSLRERGFTRSESAPSIQLHRRGIRPGPKGHQLCKWKHVTSATALANDVPYIICIYTYIIQ